MVSSADVTDAALHSFAQRYHLDAIAVVTTVVATAAALVVPVFVWSWRDEVAAQPRNSTLVAVSLALLSAVADLPSVSLVCVTSILAVLVLKRQRPSG